jgi:hypothetical protein
LLANIGWIFKNNRGGARFDASPLLLDEGQNYTFLALLPLSTQFKKQVE